MKKLTPNLMVRDVRDTVEFYRNTLGFTLIMAVPETQDGILTDLPDGMQIVYALMKNGGAEIMFQSEKSLREDVPALVGTQLGASISLYMEVEKIDGLYRKLQSKAEIVKPMQTTWYGMNEFYIRDNNGYILCFAEPSQPG
jgi:uncharacterized glyoxalase superfamily protein PhnB